MGESERLALAYAYEVVLADREILIAALRRAKGTIKVWHGELGWDLYQNSPEMKQINAALTIGEEIGP